MIAIALVLLALGGGCFVGRLLVGPSIADRVVALDGLVVTIVAAIILHAANADAPAFVDVAVVVAFVGFVGTAASARFIERRGG